MLSLNLSSFSIIFQKYFVFIYIIFFVSSNNSFALSENISVMNNVSDSLPVVNEENAGSQENLFNKIYNKNRDDNHFMPFKAPPGISIAREVLGDDFSNDDVVSGAWHDTGESIQSLWHSVVTEGSTVNETNGQLQLRLAGGKPNPQARVTSGLRPELNIFRSHHKPISFIVTTLEFTTSAASDVETFSFTILSEAHKNAWEADDAIVLEITAEGELKFISKENQPNSIGEVLLDTKLKRTPRGFSLTLDEMNFKLEMFWQGGWASFSGMHGLNKEKWNSNTAASVELRASRSNINIETAIVSIGSLRVVEDLQLGSEGVWSKPNNLINFFPPAYILVNGFTDSSRIQAGYLPVTLYGADPTGKRDSTAQIQKAIDDAYHHSLICFFPPGTYLVSKQLKIVQRSIWIESIHRWKKMTSYANLLMGSRSGPRPILKLVDRSPVFSNEKIPRPLLKFTSERADRAKPSYSHPPHDTNQPNINFNQLFKGIDIDLGVGNPGAVGLDIMSAQGTTIEDVLVKAKGAFAGFSGGSGAGGAWFNVEVQGGKYGLLMNFSGVEQALVVGAKLTEQQEAAIVANGQGVALIVGADVRKKDGTAIILGDWPKDNSATLNLVDARIRFSNPGTLISNPNSKSLYLRNVSVFNAAKLATYNTQSIEGNPNQWKHLRHYVHDSESALHVVEGAVSHGILLEVDGRAVDPGNLVAQHLYPDDFPDFEDGDIINVKINPPRKFRARGDGRTDDTEALQYAIKHYKKIFLPKGVYLISKTLNLGAETQLIGTSRIHTILVSNATKWDPKIETPLISTVDDANAHTILSSLQLKSTVKNVNFAVLWRAGRHSIMKDTWGSFDYNNKGKVNPINIHSFVITGNGGGRFYNAFNLSGLSWKKHGANYRRVFVEGTREPITIYSFNPERSWGNYKSEFRNARNIQIYGVKDERGPPTALFINCDNVSLIGHGGDVRVTRGKNHKGVYEFINSKNIELGGLFRWNRYPNEVKIDDNIIYDKHDGKIFSVHFSKMVTYFRRGIFQPVMPSL